MAQPIQLTPKDVDELLGSLKKLLEYWMRIKLVLVRAFGGESIGREHESAFLQLKSDVSRTYRIITTRLPEGLAFEGDKMIEMLKNAINMEQLRSLPVAEKQSIYATWHRVYIRITRTYGAMEVMHAGFFPHHRQRLKPWTVAQKGSGGKK